MPLFGGGKKASSVREVADWERAMSFLTEKTGEEYEVAFSQLPLGMFGRSEFEILRDKKHTTMLYPSSFNSARSFYKKGYVKEPLEDLDVGFAPDGTGTSIVGREQSFADRRFVDGYVGCMKNVYKVSSDHIHALVRGGQLPVFLISESLSIAIAPYVFRNQHLEPTGKYQPP